MDRTKGSQLSTRYRVERSYGGYRFDELKSGLQKYIRRGEAQKALRCYLEAESFAVPELEVEPRAGRGGGLRTNLLHRLMVIYLEDVGPANFELWEQLSHLMFSPMTGMVTNRADGKSATSGGQPVSAELQLSIEHGATIVLALANSMHSRELSHLNLAVSKVEHLSPDDPTVAELRKEIHSYPGPDASALVASLRAGSVASYYFARRILGGESPGKHYRSQKPIFYLIHLLSEFPAGEQVSPMAVQWAKELTVTEQFLIPYLMMARILGKCATPNTTGDITVTRLPPYLGHLASLPPILFDEYVVDMHTARGRGKGKGRTEFAESGSLVLNEWPGTDQRYKAIYEKSKTAPGYYSETPDHPIVFQVLPDTGEKDPPVVAPGSGKGTNTVEPLKESALFEFRVRAQLNTTAYKPDTYLANLTAEGHRVVLGSRPVTLGRYPGFESGRVFVKGPYRSVAEADRPVKLAEWRTLFGLPTIVPTRITLLPDLFTGRSGLGSRYKLSRAEPYSFLISEDLTMEDPLPTHRRSSKAWSEEAAGPMADWVNISSIGEPNLANPVEARGFLEQLLYRWLFGIPDCSLRNFIAIRWGVRKGQVIAVDEEGFGKNVDIVQRRASQWAEGGSLRVHLDEAMFVKIAGWERTLQDHRAEFVRRFEVDPGEIEARFVAARSRDSLLAVLGLTR